MPQQHHDDIASQLELLLQHLGLTLRPGALIQRHVNILQEFTADKMTMGSQYLDKKWKDRFQQYYQARIVVGKLVNALSQLAKHATGTLKSTTKAVLAGSLDQDFNADQAKDHFYELELGSWLSAAGFDVELRDPPDLIVKGEGLQRAYAIACKYPSSAAGLSELLYKGHDQVRKTGLAGFVAIGLDLITFKRSTEFGAYLDFRSGNRASVEVLRQKLQYYSHIIMGDYKEQHVVRPPSHGLLLTLSPGVIYSVPRLMPSGILEFHADITNIIFADFSLDSGSGLKDDISLILSRILQLNRTADV